MKASSIHDYVTLTVCNPGNPPKPLKYALARQDLQQRLYDMIKFSPLFSGTTVLYLVLTFGLIRYKRNYIANSISVYP
jgi:hypothetical protein